MVQLSDELPGLAAGVALGAMVLGEGLMRAGETVLSTRLLDGVSVLRVPGLTLPSGS
jgi:archaellum biogenesis ATPase FlaH